MTLTANHARYLRRLIGESQKPIFLPTVTKAILLAALQAAEIEMLQTIGFISPFDYTQRPVCGVWNLHHLIGHLADWDRYFLNWLAAMTHEPQQALYWDDDGNRFNAWLQEQRRDEAWQQTWRDFRQNRWRFQQQLKTVPDTILLEPQQNTPFPTIGHCAWSALEHYLDHAAGVRCAIGLPLAKDLLAFHGPYTD